jgi:uncharacterized membrane protein YeaQ/YmgE (transglycosylase-associated protein family)
MSYVLAAIPGITFNLDFVSWIVVGLLAGFIGSSLVRGRGFGCLGNLIVGLIGAVIGGYIASALGWGGVYHFWGSLALAIIGAALFVFIIQLFTGGFSSSRNK